MSLIGHGVEICTSTTRPTPVSGSLIYETDTQKLMLWNGSNWAAVRVFSAESGTIVKQKAFTNSTRLAYSAASSVTLWSGISFEKEFGSSVSDLLLTGFLQIRGGWWYAVDYRITINGSNYDGYIGHNDTGDNNSTYHANYMRSEPIAALITNQSAGTKSISIIGRNANGTNFQAGQFNPSSVDDARFSQTKSTLIVTEILK